MKKSVEFLDPKDYASFRESNEFKKLKTFSLLEAKRIGWNYPLDYSFIIQTLHELPNLKGKKIIDIGCGPGAVHGYLEDLFGIDIIGVDMKHWDKDYVDFIGDFTNNEFRQTNNLNNADIIISTSAFEHNTVSAHANLMISCYKSLNEDGVLIFTSAGNNRKFPTKFRKSFQINLSPVLIEKLYGLAPSNLDIFNELINSYADDKEISEGFLRRFEKNIVPTLNFLPLGCKLNKDDIPLYKPSLAEKLVVIG